MNFLVWFAFAFMALYGLVDLFKPDIIQYISRNDRVRMATSTSRDNVRIVDAVSNVVYKSVSRTPINGDESLVELVGIHSPYTVLKVLLSESQFKHSPFDTLDGGRVQYRVVLKDNGVSNPGDAHPALTNGEISTLYEENKRKLLEKDGEISTLEAGRFRAVEDTVEHVRGLAGSKSHQPPGSKR